MTIDDLLSIAITHEVRSQALYRHLRGIVSDEITQACLTRLEMDECDHERRLYEIRATIALSTELPIADADFANEVRNSHAVYVTLDMNASREDVLRLAIQRERRAVQLFQRLAAHASDADSRKIFERLGVEEEAHERALLQLFDAPPGAEKIV